MLDYAHQLEFRTRDGTSYFICAVHVSDVIESEKKYRYVILDENSSKIESGEEFFDSIEDAIGGGLYSIKRRQKK